MDEVYGYLPPHPANPPSKVPMMTLLKQARAYGVGVLLATQNPVDLDYKALSNAGTWFVGKLQTERDKARLLDGLEGVAAERGTLTDRNYLESVISALRNRVFLLHNVHQPKPVVFQSRWALSFLRGPMTRDHVATLMKPVKERLSGKPTAIRVRPAVAIPLCRKCHAELPPGTAPCPKCGEPRALAPARVQDEAFKQKLQQQAQPVVVARPQPRPELPDDVPQFFLPPRRPLPEGASVVYQPRLLALAEVSFVDRRRGLDHRRTYRLLADAPAPGQAINWLNAEAVEAEPLAAPLLGAGWAPVPESVNSAKRLKALEKSFAEFLYASARLRLFENKKLGLVSAPQEDIQTFLKRCQEAALREAGKAYEAERLKYLPRFNAVNLPMPSYAPDRGNSLVGWLTAPFKLGASAVKAVTSSPSKKQAALEAEWKGKVAALYEKWRQVGDEHGELLLTPRKVDVQVTGFGIGWLPM
jgi:ribosomal protein L40E